MPIGSRLGVITEVFLLLLLELVLVLVLVLRRERAADGFALELSRGGTRLCRVRLDAADFVTDDVVELDDVVGADEEERVDDEETTPSIGQIRSSPSLWLK